MKERLKTVKGKIIAAAGTAGVIGIIAAGILLSGGRDAYRTISVEETNGTSVVQNAKESRNVYKGMHLYSGDSVSVQSEADMTLLLDMDKYVYVEENTDFRLEAEGSSEKSRTRICLEEGAALNYLNTKLTEGEVYQVDTPNSVMAVRGTIFRVKVYYDDNGVVYTEVEVYQGAVTIDLKTVDGDFNGISETFEAGEAALIRGGADFSEFVRDETGSVKRKIEYRNLPKETAKQLAFYIDSGERLCIDKELLMDYAALEEHKLRELVIEEATCEKEGKKEIRCTVCNQEKETVKLPRLSHEKSQEWETVKAPDCLSEGMEQLSCRVCGKVLEERKIAALGHTKGKTVIIQQPGCGKEGTSAIYCTVCNEIIETESLPALSHEAGKWQVVKESSCTETGEKRKSCVHCGKIMETAATEVQDHSYGAWNDTQTADCVKEGSRERICANCGKKETAKIAALGHSYGEWKETQAADCVKEGNMERVCANCGKKETTKIAALGHSYVEWKEALAADCVKEGSRERVCANCGKKETEKLQALGHSYGEWKETRAADCASEGSRERTCIRCQNTETEVVPENDNHSWETRHEMSEQEQVADEMTFNFIKTCSKCKKEESTLHTCVKMDNGLYCEDCKENISY